MRQLPGRVRAVAKPARAERGAQRRSHSWRALEMALWLLGLLALAWVGWSWLDARLYQQRQERLLAAALGGTDGGDPTPTAGDAAAAEARGPAVDERAVPLATEGKGARATEPPSALPRASTAAARALAGLSMRDGRDAALRASRGALGRLTIPRLGLTVMVAEGVDAHTLRRAAGHVPGTSPLGGAGNVAIAAHRDGFFRPLKDVRVGDDVVVTTSATLSRYRVEWVEVVPPSDASSLAPTSYAALTLVTCHPFYYVGAAPDRFIVRARMVERRAATPADAPPGVGR